AGQGGRGGGATAFAGGGDGQLLTILGDRPPRDMHALAGQQRGDGVVGQRPTGRFGFDQAPHHRPHGGAGDVGALQADGEEVLELEGAARGLNVLATGDARNGGLVHADLV